MAITNNRTIMSDATSGALSTAKYSPQSPDNSRPSYMIEADKAARAAEASQAIATAKASAQAALEAASARALQGMPAVQAARAAQAQTPGSTDTGSSSSASVSTGPDYASYYNSILETLNAQRAAQEAAARQNYENSVARMRDAYNNSVNNLNNQSEEALRQAYISNMLGKRNMNQTLSNMGINGGATESMLANLENNYQSDRNGIAKALLSSLQGLESDYNNNLASLSADINNTNASILDNYYNKVLNYEDGYASRLADLAAKSAGNSTTTSTTENDAGRNAVINAIKNLGAGTSNLSRILQLYGYQPGTEEANKILVEAGYDPYSLNSTPGRPVSPVGSSNTGSISTSRSNDFSAIQDMAAQMQSRGNNATTIRQMLQEALQGGAITQQEYNELAYAYRA